MSSAASSKPRSLDSATGVTPLASPTSPMSQTPLLPETGHVSVARAEAAFRAVDSELKDSLRRSQEVHRVRSAKEKDATAVDVEKGGPPSTEDEEEEPFDLEAILRGDRAAAEAEGFAFKEVGVLWRDMTVRGMGGLGKLYVKTFPSAFVHFFNMWPRIKRLAFWRKDSGGSQVEILKGFRGLVKPGEMLLVLGRPGSGCTSFLKVISNQRFGYSGIDGDVRYGPFDHDTFGKWYRGEAVYNAEDESQSMHPTLTVRQTLDFALDTKVPGSRPAGLSRKEFKEKVIDMLLKMFNIEVRSNSYHEHTDKPSTRPTPLSAGRSCAASPAASASAHPSLR
jgi:ATP-binding cassette subfamily G (WHITE) protein 2 (SNQ2)